MDPNTDEPVVFLSWEPEDIEPSRKSGTRAYHRKSRAGCHQCRMRRVKCDEEHPICRNCQRQQVQCIWNQNPDLQSLRIGGSGGLKSHVITPGPLSHPISSLDVPRLQDIPESKTRRLSELYLLHHFTTVTSGSFNLPNSKTLNWSTLVPPLAFQHDSLLYAIYAITSLHLAHLNPNNSNHLEKYQEYFGLCLRIHRDNVAILNANNADAAMLTSTILRITSLAILQRRDLEENGKYVPPVEWLVMNFGTGHGLGVAAWQFLIHDETSVTRKMIGNNTPGLDPSSRWLRDDKVFASGNITRALSPLLHRTNVNELEGPWDEGTQEAYERTAAYIGSCQQAMDGSESESDVVRRMMLFPTVIERKFASLVEEKRDRALVMLAHYFALWRKFEGLWWCGKVGEREVGAISAVVGTQWEDLLPRLIEMPQYGG